MTTKEEILEKIRSVQSTLNNTVYPLVSELDCTSVTLFFEVLDFIKWVEKEYPDNYEAYGLAFHFNKIIQFGLAYQDTFKPFPFQISIDEDGILPIGLPINEMITRFYEYVVNLKDDTASIQPVQTSFDMSVINAMAKQVETLTGIAKQVNELHAVQTGALYSGKTRLTAKEKKAKEEAEYQAERKRIHQSWLNEM